MVEPPVLAVLVLVNCPGASGEPALCSAGTPGFLSHLSIAAAHACYPIRRVSLPGGFLLTFTRGTVVID